MAYPKTAWVNDSTPAISAQNLNKIEQGIYDANFALPYKVDAVYGGATTSTYLTATAGKTWHATLGNLVNASNRAASSQIEYTPDMKSFDVTSSYRMIVYGNNEGVGNPLTQVSGTFVSSFDMSNFAYKYIYIIIGLTTSADIPSDLTNVLSVTKYNSVLDFALEGDLNETKTKLNNKSDDLFNAEKQTGYINLDLHTDNIINYSVNANTGLPMGSDSTRACNKELIKVVPNVPIYFTMPSSGYLRPLIYYFLNGTYKGYDASFYSGDSYNADEVRFLFIKNPTTADITPQDVVENFTIWQESEESYNNRIKTLEDSVFGAKYITCWGDSLTSMAGWTNELATLTGLQVRNAGVGGEGINQIRARQGADAYIINNITIPANTSEVTLTTNAEGFDTQLGVSGIKPNFTGNLIAHFNPCKIGEIEGTLTRNGTGSSDTITFARKTSGSAVTITRPETIRTNADMNWNDPYLMIIFMGQNTFGYDNDEEITGQISDENIKKCIESTRLMIEHSKAENYLVLGIATGNTSSDSAYENAMQKEFGRYFFSVRQYLAHPIYDNNEQIISCWGLQDLEETATAQDLTDIANGKVPPACFMDGIHFVEDLRPFIGEAIYNRCVELNIF